MRGSLTVDDVLTDIEFELAQGAVSRDDLGQSIQAVRQFQNAVRTEVFKGSARRVADVRDVVSRQFQINDMMIVLLQEMAARLQELQLELRLQPAPPPDTGPAGVPAAETGSVVQPVQPSAERAPSPAAPWQSVEGSLDLPPGRIDPSLGMEELVVEPDVRPVGIPLVGGLLTRFRAALHSLALFYVNRLAVRQTAANQALSSSLLYLTRLQERQQAQIEALSASLAALEARLAEGRQSPTSDDR